MVREEDNPAHNILPRDEFDKMLEFGERWKFIKESIFAQAYDDLRLNTFENSEDALLTTVVGFRGHEANSVVISHISFLIKANPNGTETSE